MSIILSHFENDLRNRAARTSFKQSLNSYKYRTYSRIRRGRKIFMQIKFRKFMYSKLSQSNLSNAFRRKESFWTNKVHSLTISFKGFQIKVDGELSIDESYLVKFFDRKFSLLFRRRWSHWLANPESLQSSYLMFMCYVSRIMLDRYVRIIV